MTDRTSFEEINNGDYLKEGYYNGILSAVQKYKTSSNTIQTSAIASYATKRTTTFSAGEVRGNVYVRFNLRAISDQNGDHNCVPYAQITNDSVQVEEIVGQSSAFDTTAAQTIYTNRCITGGTGVYMVVVTPSTAQKAAGFVIDLDLKLDNTDGDAYNDYWEVWYE